MKSWLIFVTIQESFSSSEIPMSPCTHPQALKISLESDEELKSPEKLNFLKKEFSTIDRIKTKTSKYQVFQVQIVYNVCSLISFLDIVYVD